MRRYHSLFILACFVSVIALQNIEGNWGWTLWAWYGVVLLRWVVTDLVPANLAWAHWLAKWAVIVTGVVWAIYILVELVPRFIQGSIDAGWIGIALPLAIILPSIPIIIVLGGHKPILDWFNSLRRKA